MNCVTPRTSLQRPRPSGHGEVGEGIVDAAGRRLRVEGCAERVVCEGDALLPTARHRQFAELAGSTIEKCRAGPMVMESAAAAGA